MRESVFGICNSLTSFICWLQQRVLFFKELEAPKGRGLSRSFPGPRFRPTSGILGSGSLGRGPVRGCWWCGYCHSPDAPAPDPMPVLGRPHWKWLRSVSLSPFPVRFFFELSDFPQYRFFKRLASTIFPTAWGCGVEARFNSEGTAATLDRALASPAKTKHPSAPWRTHPRGVPTPQRPRQPVLL